MARLNRKGFTLVEVLAVVVILGVIMLIAVPNVNHLIQQNREDSYEKLKQNFIQAAKAYFSDNRYKISVNMNGACDSYHQRDVIGFPGINDGDNSKIRISLLVDRGYLKLSNNKITNPKNRGQSLKSDSSYVTVKYNCSRKDFDFTIEDGNLIWQ